MIGASWAQFNSQSTPKDKAAYFPNTDIQGIWKDRIVKESDAPLVHFASADIWVTQAGSATAITGGKLIGPEKRPNSDDTAGKSISGGSEQRSNRVCRSLLAAFARSS